MSMSSQRFSFLFVICLLMGCETDGAGGDGDPSAQMDARVARDVGLGGGTGGIVGQGGALVPDTGMSSGGAMGAGGGMGGSEDDMGPPAECAPGESRCPREGGDVREYCNVSGRWAEQPCSAGDICLNGGCVRDPSDCMPGEQVCLPNGLPAECRDGAWVPGQACTDRQICIEGECTGEACANAAQRSSYLGCDYLAADLPNGALDPAQATTQDAPAAVVLANPDPEVTVTVGVFDADGQPTQLVAEQFIAVPVIPNLDLGMYQPSTVTSNVRVGDMVVTDRIDRGVGIEIPPGGLATLLLPRRLGPLNESSLRPDAFRIRTDHPVAAYLFGPYCCNYSFSNDASLLFPTTALGQRYLFTGTPDFASVGGPPGFHSPPVIAVMAPHDNTNVVVDLAPDMRIDDSSSGNVRLMGGDVEVTMNAQDVLLLSASSAVDQFNLPDIFNPTDLTGTEVSADKPVAVFSTHVCTNYPQFLAACDALQEQLMPVRAWGSSFQLVPPAERGRNQFSEVIYWKFLGQDVGEGEPPTRITLSVPFGQLNPAAPGFASIPDCAEFVENGDTIVLGSRQYCEFGTKRPLQATSNRPVQVMGILAGQQATGLNAFGSHAGDPALFLVTPDRQYRRDYAFLTPDTYFSDYVTVITPMGNELILDDVPVDLGDAIPIVGSPFVFKHISIDDGPHRIVGRGNFGILVYAYDDFVSYAFPGGLNLTKD